MIRPVRSTLAVLTLVAMLGACHSQQKAGHGEVSGQILPGSVSDAMLPYDAVKSKAPLAPPEATDQKPDAGDEVPAATAASGDSAAPEITASPAPIVPATVQ